MKNCIKCEIQLTEFNWTKAKQNKKHYICKGCSKVYLSQYYGKNFQVIRQRTAKAFKNTPLVKYSDKWISRLLSHYKHKDAKKYKTVCDLTIQDYKNLVVGKSCTYCQDFNGLGLDRIDCSLGHTKNNVVVCCIDCNTAKSNLFSKDEMLIIGQAIKEVKLQRTKTSQKVGA